jgi:hypothetical protein
MAKKPTKTARIREYVAANPDASTGEAADALKKFGINAQMVSNIKSRDKRATAPKGKRGRPRKRQPAKHTLTPTSTSDATIAAIRLIRACGSLDAATSVLEEADRINQAIED